MPIPQFDRVARATELALEQQDRFDRFKRFYKKSDTITDVIVAFLEEPSEAHQAFLIGDHLVKAHNESKEASTTK